jgi:hypothetical protein
MNALTSRRDWFPSAVAPVSWLLGLAALQVVSHFALNDVSAPLSRNASVPQWLGRTYVGFFGPGALDPSHGKVLLGTLVAAVVLLVVGFLGSWWVFRAVPVGAPGLPAFLSLWMVLVIATALAALASFAVSHAQRFGSISTGEALVGALSAGVVFGVKWGWIAAGLSTLARRRATHPAATAAAVSAPAPEQPRQPGGGEPGVVPAGGFVLKRLSDFPEVTLDELPASGVPGGNGSAPAPAPAPATDPRPAPAAATDPPPAPAAEPDQVPDTQAAEDEDPAPRYVGRRAAERAEDSPPESVEDAPRGRRARTDG